jgi:hypothetical protein
MQRHDNNFPANKRPLSSITHCDAQHVPANKRHRSTEPTNCGASSIRIKGSSIASQSCKRHSSTKHQPGVTVAPEIIHRAPWDLEVRGANKPGSHTPKSLERADFVGATIPKHDRCDAKRPQWLEQFSNSCLCSPHKCVSSQPTRRCRLS